MLAGMARKLKVEQPRGDRREPIFKDDEDRQHFAEVWGGARF